MDNNTLNDAVVNAIQRLQDKVTDNHNSTQIQLGEVNVTLAKQEENLRMHMYRTEIAEKRLEHIEADLKPIKNVLAGAKGVFAIIGAIGTILGVIAAVYEVLAHVL